MSEKAVQLGASRLWWKELWKRWVLSLERNGECVMEGESGEQVGSELESVTSSAGCFMQG